MSITRWKPFHHEFEDLFDQLLLQKRYTDLATDVYEENNTVVVEMHIPGIDSDKIDIKVEENHLHIKGSRDEKKEVHERHYFHKEILHGSFERIIPLPTMVSGNEAHAECKDGILRITIPKKQKNPSNSIKIHKK